jgi:hypothetical protein
MNVHYQDYRGQWRLWLYFLTHMFVQDDFYQAEPDVVAAIMTQLSLKSGLKEWGKKGFKAYHS